MRLALGMLLITGCSAVASVELPFVAEVGGAPFACGTTFDGIGTSSASVTFTDARVYVHDVQLLDAQGDALEATIDPQEGGIEGVWLLDFEDGTAGCATGSPETNTTLTGEVAGQVAGVRFTVGVPESLNHLDPLDAQLPLNAPGMFWSWTGGYKFTKVEVTSPAREAFWVHVGASGCTGSPAEGFSCTTPNLATVTVRDLDLTDGAVKVDLGALFADSDVEAPAPEGDTTPGCMSGPTDPECVGVFASLGLPFLEAAGGEQAVFSVGSR